LDWLRRKLYPGRSTSDSPATTTKNDSAELFPEQQSTTSAQTLSALGCFPLAPRASVVLTQRFIDEVLKIPGVTANKHRDGIQFRPNFVWVERVYTVDHGFKLSLKGAEAEITQHLPNALPGRWNFTRARIDSEATLAGAIECIPIAWRAR
jgi:hypothetical protein